MTTAPRPRDLRASDADRERVADVLAEAAADGRLTADEHAQRLHLAYHSRTLGELAALTEDLLPPSAQPLRLDSSPVVSAFFATVRREGRWVVPARLTVSAVGGQVVLDVREAILQSAHTVVAATLVGSQLHLLVPDGVSVAVTSARAPWRAGGDTRQIPAAQSFADGAFVEVQAFTLAGRVHVHTPRPPSRWRRRARRGAGRA